MPDTLNVVVDTSHHNGNINFKKQKTPAFSAFSEKQRKANRE